MRRTLASEKTWNPPEPTAPPHALVKSAGVRDHFGARPQHEVVCIPQHHLRTVLDKVARLKRLHRALRADIHEYRRLNDTVRR